MFTLKKEFINNNYPVGSLDNLQIEDAFCYKYLKNENSKCRKFYSKFYDNDKNWDLCPYGYCCFKTHKNAEVVLCSVVCDKSDIKKLKDRNKRTNNSTLIKAYRFEEILRTFSDYSDYILCVNVSNTICHDLNNAYNYFLELIELVNTKTHKTIIDHYNEAIDLTRKLQENSVYCKYEPNKEYSSNEIRAIINQLLNQIETAYIYGENKLNELGNEIDNIVLSLYSGFSLLRTLLRRSMLTFDDYQIEETKTHVHLHKLVKKVMYILKYKAETRNVRFTDISGYSTSTIYVCKDSIFTAIFTIFDNAIKYSNSEEEINVFIQEKNGLLTLRVVNNSKPLTSFDLDHLHDKGYRGTNQTKKGNGLGLYIVDSICKTNGVINSAEYSNGRFSYSFTFKIH